MHYSQIIFEIDGAVATLTLNNPQKINSLSKIMVHEMMDVLKRVGSDETIKVLIIRANGQHFCAGHDLSEMDDRNVKEYTNIFDKCTEMMMFIHQIPQPVIAEVRGVATAAGCQLVAWCDLAVAEEGARFATPGVKIGLFCTTPMVAISRAIGRKAAMEMLLTGRYFPASEARELGLINRVVPAEKLSEETKALAEQIAESSAFVLGIGKRAFYSQINQPDVSAFSFAKTTMTMNAVTEDAQIGIKAFLDRKKPEWKNQ